ncbi:MAG TPA: HAD-IB family phosphatase, partial [Thermoflexales bacterium]|nr:HAD-IB family phosphatase [Thermoflexales bacterium]
MTYDDIFFDCDSTLSAIEGIDELARLKGAGERIAALTNAAMNGGLRLEQVYGERLRLIQPNRADLAAIAEQYQQAVVPGAREVVAALHTAGKRVFIISGGLSDAVIPFGVWLGVPAERIRAVGLRFDAV